MMEETVRQPVVFACQKSEFGMSPCFFDYAPDMPSYQSISEVLTRGSFATQSAPADGYFYKSRLLSATSIAGILLRSETGLIRWKSLSLLSSFDFTSISFGYLAVSGT